jgi:hypothetical protein
MSTKRSRVVVIAAAGTLTLATAISAAAALPASPPAAASADAAYTTTIGRSAAVQTARPAVGSGSRQVIVFDRMRSTQGQFQHERQVAAAKAAAKAAAAKAAARQAAAAKAAALKAAQQAAAARQATAQATAAGQAAQPAQQAAAIAPSGSAEQIAEQMLSQFGWSSGQFSCLQPLWQQESGWNAAAENPTSGAYGIPQALPGSKMASAGSDWASNPATQIRWGLTYIQGSYGSPCGAWSHEESDGWY